MSRGGPRPNSGRKSNAELAQCHAQMDAAITPADWNAIYARLVQIAKEGDAHSAVQAARLLIHQRWGDGAVPQSDPDDADDVCEINFIHVDTSAAAASGAVAGPDEEDDSDDDTGESIDEEPAYHESQSAIAPPQAARNPQSKIPGSSRTDRNHQRPPHLPFPPRPGSGVGQPGSLRRSSRRDPGR